MQNVDAVNVSGTGQGLVDHDDGSLLAMARAGSSEAYATLFSRHSYAAHRLARHLGQREDSDDVVSEAFAQVLDLLGRGKGPETAFRAYLFTTVRHECARRAKARKRVTPTDDLQQIDSAVAFANGELDDFERAAIRAAYESLPSRWRTVLWHLDVEGRKPSELGPLLDLSANSVSALVYRARAGLREAYLQQHVKQDHPGDSRACAEHRAKLSAFVRRTASDRDQQSVHAHLETCGDCMAIYLDLREVNRDVGLVADTTVVVGAVGLSLASLGAHASVLLKSIAAVLAPPAAAAAIATVAVVGVTRPAAPEPARYSLASAPTEASDHRATATARRAQPVQPASAAAGVAAPDVTSSLPRPVPSTPAAAPSEAVPAPSAEPSSPDPKVASPTPASVAGVPPGAVRVDAPSPSGDLPLPRLAVSAGSVELTVGGPDGLLSLRTGP
jgi:RNA polymerase sigma factor (sigma-70 family)